MTKLLNPRFIPCRLLYRKLRVFRSFVHVSSTRIITARTKNDQTGRLKRAESNISFLFFLPQNDILTRITISHIRNTRYAIFLWFESVFDRSFHVAVYRFAVFQQCRLGLPYHTTDSNCCHRKRREEQASQLKYPIYPHTMNVSFY